MELSATIRRQLLVSVLIRLGLVMALLAGLFLVAGRGSPVYADTTRTIEVDAIADDNPGGGCTLREAIDTANAGAGGGQHANGCTVIPSGSGVPIVYEINLPAYTYTLTGAADDDDNDSGDLDVKANLVLTGQGADDTLLDGGGVDRVLHLDPLENGGLVVELSGLTVQNGLVTGNGGGIDSSADTLTIRSCKVSGNETLGGGIGTGLYIGSGSVDITDSTFARNRNTASGAGAVHNSSTVTISRSTIDDNRAQYGGGINNNGTMTITHSLVSNNRADEKGGGIRNGALGTLYLTHSTVYSNTAEQGGGISNSERMTLSHSTIYSNTAEDGGGIYHYLDSTETTIVNSTLSANKANRHGGGLYHSHQGSINLSNVTITDNWADEENENDGHGGGVYNEQGTLAVKNTIIAGNHDTARGRQGIWPDCIGTLTSGDFNLIGHLGDVDFPCVVTGVTDNNLIGDPAELDALQDNGGATETHALLAGSPAIDHIPLGTNGCGTDPLDEDQRDVARPQGAACDIGAYEASAFLAIDKAVEPQTDVAYHGPVTYTIVLSNTGVVPGSDVQLRDTLPDEVDFARWLQQPEWASVGDDELTWSGTVPSDTAITFVFVVSHTGGYGDVVVNTAVYSHTVNSGSDEATFTVESGSAVYLPLVLRSWP